MLNEPTISLALDVFESTDDNITQPAFTSSKSTIETLEKGVKYVGKLTIKTPELRVSIVNFDQVKASWVSVFPMTNFGFV